MNKKVPALLSVAHLITDVNQGTLPALLPFFKESMNLSYTLAVVMVQTFLPQNLAMASGLAVGFAVGMGGVGVTLLGAVADAWGVPAAMKAILILPVLGFLLTLLMEYPPKKEDEAKK